MGQQLPQPNTHTSDMSAFSSMGEEFLTTAGETVSLSDIQGEGKLICVYFSAHWCPPCRGFTPQLVKTYSALKAAGKPIECIFVSSDRSPAEFKSYFGTMPWLAIPHGDKRAQDLMARFKVQGIPTLVLLNGATGKVITTDGRGCVMADPKGSGMPFPASSQEQVAGIKNALDGKPARKPSFVARLFRGNRAAAGA